MKLEDFALDKKNMIPSLIAVCGNSTVDILDIEDGRACVEINKKRYWRKVCLENGREYIMVNSKQHWLYPVWKEKQDEFAR